MVKTTKAGIILYVFSSLLTGCAKGPITPNDPATANHQSSTAPYDKDRLQKIEKFISISWETPIDKVIYNDKKQDFTFGSDGEIIMSREKIENLYDSANEYKLKHEK